MLLPDQRALLVTYCNDHPIVVCPNCAEVLPFERIAADVIMGKRDFCPACRTDLTAELLRHLAECTLRQVQEREIRERARETRQEARETAKCSRHVRDAADVLGREAEDVQARSRSVRRCEPGGGPNGSASGDPTWAALRESERLRESGQAALDKARQIGTDYIPTGHRDLPDSPA